jgi:hypothetical protein
MFLAYFNVQFQNCCGGFKENNEKGKLQDQDMNAATPEYEGLLTTTWLQLIPLSWKHLKTDSLF